MSRVIIQEETTKNPITLIGKEAGVCWGADTSDDKLNYKRGIACLESGHGRTFEFPQVYMILDGYSARVMREFYTHIGGMPTRLQESTRYINEGEFKYITPPSIRVSEEGLAVYNDAMENISYAYKTLEELGIPREDIANILPLGMTSNVVVRTNLRNLIDMSHQRMCGRAYWEFRRLMNDIAIALSEYSEEWAYIVTHYFEAKCEVVGYCTERNSCGRKPRKEV